MSSKTTFLSFVKTKCVYVNLKTERDNHSCRLRFDAASRSHFHLISNLYYLYYILNSLSLCSELSIELTRSARALLLSSSLIILIPHLSRRNSQSARRCSAPLPQFRRHIQCCQLVFLKKMLTFIVFNAKTMY